MLIKLRIIGLVFILLLSTSLSFGQDKSLQELQQKLTDWTNIVNNNEWWFFPTRSGPPDLLRRGEGIIPILKMLEANSNSTYPFNTKNALRLIKDLRAFSDRHKQAMHNTYIPQLKEQIKNHPDNPNYHLNPIDYNVDPIPPGPEPTGANLCPRTGTPSAIVWIRGNSNLGTRCHYHLNGELHEEVSYQNKKLHGTKAVFWDNGKERQVHTYKNGKRHGPDQYSWHKNGNPMNISDYTDGRKNGKVETFSKNGNPSTCWMYSHGTKTHNCSQ